MSARELTEKYLAVIFSGGNLNELESLFAPDLKFTGPWFQFSSASDYIASLRKQPFEGVQYEIMKSYGDENSACVIYTMSAHGRSNIPMAVFTTTNSSKIVSILLIFDTAVFDKTASS